MNGVKLDLNDMDIRSGIIKGWSIVTHVQPFCKLLRDKRCIWIKCI